MQLLRLQVFDYNDSSEPLDELFYKKTNNNFEILKKKAKNYWHSGYYSDDPESYQETLRSESYYYCYDDQDCRYSIIDTINVVYENILEIE